MSMSDLGYYEKSYRLMMLPLQNITQVITPVMHPIFSDFQNDKAKLATSYERIIRILSFIGLPLSVLLFFTAEEVTLIIFGDQWMPSVPVFRILSDYTLFVRLHLSGGRRHTELVCVWSVFVHSQRDGNVDRHFLLRHTHRSGNLYCTDVYCQFRTMLLANVSRDVPEKCMDVRSSAYFSIGNQRINGILPSSCAICYGRNEHFRDNYYQKYD